MSEDATDRYLPGTLNPEAVRSSADSFEFPPSTDNTNFFAKFHEGVLRQASTNTFEGVSRYKGIVIGEVQTELVGGFFGFGGQPRYSFKVRIPELHSAIPDPCAPVPGGSSHQNDDSSAKYIGMHPTAISAVDDANGTQIPAPQMGDIVWIEFEKGPAGGRMGTPIYTGRFSQGQETNNISDVCDSLAARFAAGANGTVGGNNYAPSGGYQGDPSSWPTADSAKHFEAGEATELHDIAQAYFESLDYDWNTGPYQLNLMGLRNTNTRSNNTFDDLMVCMFTDDEGVEHVYVWPATTRPGQTALLLQTTATSNSGNVAILVPADPRYHRMPLADVIRGGRVASAGLKTYYMGPGGADGGTRGRASDSTNSYAGVSPDPMQAYKDDDGDTEFDYNQNTIKGCQQCQLHGTKAAMGDSVARSVGGPSSRNPGTYWAWSEGCQVWGAWPDYQFFLSLWQQQVANNGGDHIDYVLIRAEDAQNLWEQCSTQVVSDENQAGDPVDQRGMNGIIQQRPR